MKTTNNKKEILRYPIRLAILIVFAFFGSRCQDEVKVWEKSSDQMVITEYVYNQPELFSEFGELLKVTGIENLLRVRGPFTLLLPTDNAMHAYYESMNVTSYTELDVKVLEELVYNHIFQGQISKGLMGQGALPYLNALGDYVASDFTAEGDILINKVSNIIKSDERASNGYVHHVDHVVDVISQNVFDVLANTSGYTIFKEGLVRSGISDTLKVIEFPYGNTTARALFTLFAVPDTLYNREGINSIDDLIAKYSTDNNLTSKENGFYQYMEFHCISGTHYFTDFKPNDIYYMISRDNYLNIVADKDYKINPTSDGYTGFYFEQSNIPAKNGAIHTVNSLLPNTEALPAEIVFQVTDYFDLHQGAFYGNYYQRFYDGENTFKDIKWVGEYLMYYFKNEDAFLDADGLALNGHFSIELKTPKIRKGKYMFSTYWFGGGIMALYIDDVYVGQLDLSENVWNASTEVAEIEFTDTKQHTLRVKTLVNGNLWWDRIIFTPI